MGQKNMVKVTFDLSVIEIEMLCNCIESAIDVKHMNEQEKKTANVILEQLRKYI
jgi:hypothetical protein